MVQDKKNFQSGKKPGNQDPEGKTQAGASGRSSADSSRQGASKQNSSKERSGSYSGSGTRRDSGSRK